jgi:hypothetical protein
MAQKLDPKEVVNIEELAKSNMYQIEAILRLLVKKGIIAHREYMDEMKELKEKMVRKGTAE